MEYQHGGDIYSNKVALDYSVNISPLGTPESVRWAAQKALLHCSRYPDSQCRKLKAAISAHFHVPQEWICCGNGAADLIFAAVLAQKPKKALLPAPTFAEYRQALQAVGCEVDLYKLTEEGEFSLTEETGWLREDFVRQIEKNPYDMVFLCNPNNPTGCVTGRKAILQAAELTKKKKCMLVLDECFCDFLEDEEEVTFLPYLEKFPHVFLLRAFTKLYAMPGLRLGYGFCADAGWTEKINQVRQPWSVSGIAQAAGEAALLETEYVRHVKKLIQKEKPVLEQALLQAGCRVFSGKANYIFFAVPAVLREQEKREALFYQKMLEREILVRDCRNYPGLCGGYYRICVKNSHDNAVFIKTMREVLRELEMQRPRGHKLVRMR